MDDTPYRAYPCRWVMLGSFMLVNLVMQALWIGFLAMLFMIIFIPLSIPASWAIDRYGLRKSTCLGAALMALFAILRAFAGPSYALALAGTVGISVAQPFLLNSWTKMASHWFGESERATAVGLVTLANLLGIAVGMLASPSLVAAREGPPREAASGPSSSWEAFSAQWPYQRSRTGPASASCGCSSGF
jgi:MFS family permease